MNALPSNQCLDRVAEHKLLIIRQQEVAASLFRRGQQQQARDARSKLYQLLHRLDLMEEGALQS